MMKLALGSSPRQPSPLHRWEPRAKLVALAALIFAFAGVRQLVLLPVMAAIALSLFALARLPLRLALRRLSYPGLTIAALGVLLPFAAGDTVLWQWGILRLRQEGLLALLLIVARLLCILAVSLALFGTTSLPTLLQALRALRLPALLIDMALLAYRHLEDSIEASQRMQRAMRLRGFRGDRLTRRQLQLLARLAGSLLVRSHARSQRIYWAMRLRGYGQPSARLAWQGIDRYSWGATIAVLAIALSLLVAEVWLARAR